jgi:hypothetical protein
MQQFRVDQFLYGLPLAGAGALTALTAGSQRWRSCGSWGRPCSAPWPTRGATRTGHRLTRQDRPGCSRGRCLGVEVIAPLEVGALSTGLDVLVPSQVTTAAASRRGRGDASWSRWA